MDFSGKDDRRKNPVMTIECMIRIIEEHCEVERRDDNVMEFTMEGIGMTCIFDEIGDRMRLLAGICHIKDCHEGDLEQALEANFHSTLEPRYCTADGVVWAAFMHPIASLNSELLISALRQVAVARVTFGKEFTSGVATFGNKKTKTE